MSDICRDTGAIGFPRPLVQFMGIIAPLLSFVWAIASMFVAPGQYRVVSAPRGERLLVSSMRHRHGTDCAPVSLRVVGDAYAACFIMLLLVFAMTSVCCCCCYY